MFLPQRRGGWITLLALYGVARCLYWWWAPPNPDEAYYWLWGQHPALSYHDHPPLHAWIQGLFSRLFGTSPFVLRLPTLLTTLGTLCTYRVIVQRLYATHASTRSTMVVATVLASPLMFIFMTLAWHDHLLIFLGVTACHRASRFLGEVAQGSRGRTLDLFVAATATGLAGLTKYNAIFLAIGIALGALTRRELRPVLRDVRVYLGVLLCGLLVSPVVVWNLDHGQRSFQYQIVDRTAGDGPILQPYFIIPFILLTLALVSPFQIYRMLCFPRWRWDRSDPYARAYTSVATWVFVSSTALFASVSLRTGVLAYWNIVAYLMLFPLTVGAWHRRRFLVAEQVYGVVFALLFAVHGAVLPLSTLVDRHGDKDTRMAVGWPTVAARAQHHLARGPDRFAFIATSDYRSASALAFAMDDPDVTALSNRDDQFDVWAQAHDRTGQDALLITGDWYPMGPTLARHFDHVQTLETVAVLRFGVWIKAYEIHRGTGFRRAEQKPVRPP